MPNISAEEAERLNNIEQAERFLSIHEFSFDPKCLELAEHFLGIHTPKRILNELAQAIQDAVEDNGGIPNKEEDPGIQAGAETPFADNH